MSPPETVTKRSERCAPSRSNGVPSRIMSAQIVGTAEIPVTPRSQTVCRMSLGNQESRTTSSAPIVMAERS